jgi:DNA-binding response OmpR family regulator
MKTLRILIVEDDPLVSMGLEMMVTEVVTAAVMVKVSVAATKKILHEALDFAFLDVDVTNGKTFEIAQILERKHVPFAFMARRKNSCLLTCAACPSFPSLVTRLRLSACCRLS